MTDRRVVRLRTSYIETGKSPYPIEDTWNGIYRQRFNFYNKENNTLIRSDLSAVEIVYWIERLEAGLSEIQNRMIRDLAHKSTFTPTTGNGDKDG